MLTSLLASTACRQKSRVVSLKTPLAYLISTSKRTFASGLYFNDLQKVDRLPTAECIGTKDFTLPKTRNIGIIAHIDAGKQSTNKERERDFIVDREPFAGKTTTTERMLYYAGVTKRIGGKKKWCMS